MGDKCIRLLGVGGERGGVSGGSGGGKGVVGWFVGEADVGGTHADKVRHCLK